MSVPLTNQCLGLPALEAVTQHLLQRLTGPLELDHLEITLDVATAELVLEALPQTEMGETGLYHGTVRVPYEKIPLESVVPYPLHVTLGDAQLTYGHVREALELEHGVVLEVDEFGLEVGTPIPDDRPVTELVQVAHGAIHLVAQPASGRWLSGSRLTLYVQSSGLPNYLVTAWQVRDNVTFRDLVSGSTSAGGG